MFFIGNALLFSLFIYWVFQQNYLPNSSELSGGSAVLKYISGYLIELSLSVDNLFVIAVIFKSFKVPLKHQHKLLFLGILGAIVFRALLIGVGLVLLNKISGMTLVFGLFILFTAFKMLKSHPENEEHKPNKILKLFRILNQFDEGRYTTKINGKFYFTALFGALLTIEFTDVLFALDSIPAIFAITTDPFIVYSSNIFAIMGLRSMYFFLANMLERFAYLKYSVFAILLFVGLKLILIEYFHLPEWISLVYIALSLIVGVVVSIVKSAKPEQ